jgi:hypothetical protein
LRREYGLRPAEVADLSTREFLIYVSGLSRDALWAEAYRAMPAVADSPAAISEIFGTFLGEPLSEPPDN